jgi:hypothetical protein
LKHHEDQSKYREHDDDWGTICERHRRLLL